MSSISWMGLGVTLTMSNVLLTMSTVDRLSGIVLHRKERTYGSTGDPGASDFFLRGGWCSAGGIFDQSKIAPICCLLRLGRHLTWALARSETKALIKIVKCHQQMGTYPCRQDVTFLVIFRHFATVWHGYWINRSHIFTQGRVNCSLPFSMESTLEKGC